MSFQQPRDRLPFRWHGFLSRCRKHFEELNKEYFRNSMGLAEKCLRDSGIDKQKNREFKLKCLKKLFDTDNILCLGEVHGKNEYLQPRFRFFFEPWFLKTKNAGGSAICIHWDLLLEEVIVTHLVTCHGRDHLVNIQSGRHNLVIVNVHFGPELTLRQLRGRLRLIHPHWPAYPNGVGIILGDLNICDPGGRFDVWNQTFTDGDPRKTAVFHSFFPHVLEIAQSDYTRRDSTALGIMRTLSRIDRILSIYLWLKHDMFTVTLMPLRTRGSEPFRVITQRYASSFRSPQIDDTRANVFPVECPIITFSVPCCSSFMTTTDYLMTRFVHLLNVRFSYTKPRRRRVESSHSKHLTLSERSS